MPSGDGWQGDVLRDLRGGAAARCAGPRRTGVPRFRAGPCAEQPGAGRRPWRWRTTAGRATRYQGQEQHAGHPGGWPQQAGYQEQRQEQQAPAARAPAAPAPDAVPAPGPWWTRAWPAGTQQAAARRVLRRACRTCPAPYLVLVGRARGRRDHPHRRRCSSSP